MVKKLDDTCNPAQQSFLALCEHGHLFSSPAMGTIVALHSEQGNKNAFFESHISYGVQAGRL